MVCYKSWEEPIVNGVDNVEEPRTTQHVAGFVHLSVYVRYVPHVSWVVLDHVEDNVCVILVAVRYINHLDFVGVEEHLVTTENT